MADTAGKKTDPDATPKGACLTPVSEIALAPWTRKHLAAVLMGNAAINSQMTAIAAQTGVDPEQESFTLVIDSAKLVRGDGGTRGEAKLG